MLASSALVLVMTPGVGFLYGENYASRVHLTLSYERGRPPPYPRNYIINLPHAAGLVNHGAVVNTLMLCFGSIGVVTLCWGLVGYSLAFAPSIATGVVGDMSLALLRFGDQPREGATTITEHVYSTFQLMFAIITVAIISGGVGQKIKFCWFLLFAALWHVLVYCPLAHWIFYPGGWLASYGALDFAGGGGHKHTTLNALLPLTALV